MENQDAPKNQSIDKRSKRMLILILLPFVMFLLTKAAVDQALADTSGCDGGLCVFAYLFAGIPMLISSVLTFISVIIYFFKSKVCFIFMILGMIFSLGLQIVFWIGVPDEPLLAPMGLFIIQLVSLVIFYANNNLRWRFSSAEKREL